MGTSSSYKGTSGKIAQDLRDDLGTWADTNGTPDGSPPNPTLPQIPPQLIAQALRIPRMRSSSGGGGGGGGGSNDSAGSGRSGSSKSGPKRTITGYSSIAGRAAGVARAFREGDRASLEQVGIDFARLSALPSRAEMVRVIVDAVCESQPESNIANEEQRMIAGKIADWMLDTDLNQQSPDPQTVGRFAIGLIAAEIFLTETITGIEELTALDREVYIQDVQDSAQVLASKANLGKSSTSGDSLAKAIQSGIGNLRRMYGAKGAGA